MNRIILIGNGFDLAYGLKTSYADFIDWYWEQRINTLKSEHTNESDDGLCKLIINYGIWSSYCTDASTFDKLSIYDILNNIQSQKDKFKVIPSRLFQGIITELNDKKWVDIENEYYNLLTSIDDSDEIKGINNELSIIKKYLADYLKEIEKNTSNPSINYDIENILFKPILAKDVAVSSSDVFWDIIDDRLKYKEQKLNELIDGYHKIQYSASHIKEFKEKGGSVDCIKDETSGYPIELLLPDRIMLLNFNYTDIADKYFPKNSDKFIVNHIHGTLNNFENIIFGYGDEQDKTFKDLQKRNDKESLKNIKTIKYLEAPAYRKLLAFMESSPYQIFIIGHSCGQSDGTLLNTLFEHKNCISIKPFYYKNGDTDNYMEIVQNISRNFTDMKLMRDRVVNKTQCEPMPQAE